MDEKELPIIQATYDLVKWYVAILNRLPRAHKYGLGECGPIVGLSEEDVSQMPFALERLTKRKMKSLGSLVTWQQLIYGVFDGEDKRHRQRFDK